MKIDLYTRCWNDADMLGFFFRHYDPIVSRYVIYDDGSTDGSLDILQRHPKVELRTFAYSDADSRILSTVDFFDTCWMESRGQADWVITTDIDEHLHRPDLLAYLTACLAAGVTLIPALGYQMLSDAFPEPDSLLCRDLTMGAPWGQMNKLGIFVPDRIEETYFAPGRHGAAPTGDVVLPARDELLLLHYKYLDLDRVQARHEMCAPRSRKTDRENQYGHKYFWAREQLIEDWRAIESELVDIAAAGLTAEDTHSASRWWAGYPRSAALRHP